MAEGKLSRFLKMAGMAVSVTGRLAGFHLINAFLSDDDAKHRRAAAQAFAGRRIAKTLGELKGPVMKAGQMASISTDFLPKAFSEPLAALRKDAPSVPFSIMAKQIKSEFGSTTMELFDFFDEEPFAAASIGQVHKAKTDDGREVVVKIQYPGVDKSCDADLAHLKFVLKASGVFKKKRDVLDRFFSEMSARLHEELDYCLEADNIRTFSNFHRSLHDFLIIPSVVGERSSSKVLTLSFEPGDPIETARMYPREMRDTLGRRLMEMVFSQIFRLGTLHSDPNPANFAFHRDGRIVLYDFGSVKKFTDEERTAARRIIKGLFNEDYTEIETGMLDIGARNPSGPHIDFGVYKEWRDALKPVFDSSKAFDFGESNLHRKLMGMLPTYRHLMPSFQFPVGLMLAQRTFVGLYGNLRTLGARVSGREVVEPIVNAI